MSSRAGAKSRGRGDKRKNFRRGGGHRFSNFEVFNADGDVVSPWSKDAILNSDTENNSGSDESSDSGDDDSGSELSAGPSSRPVYIREEHTGPQLSKGRGLTKKERQEAAKRKAAMKTVQVGDMPPSSSSDEEDEDEDDEPKSKTVATKPTKKTGSILKNSTVASKKIGSSSDDDDDSSSAATGVNTVTNDLKKLDVKKDKKEDLRKQALQEQLSEEQRKTMERLRKVREEREMRQQYLDAEKESVAEMNARREARTKALLEKAQHNKEKKGEKKKKGRKF